MARAGRWSAAKTALITLLCGIGHVLSSVAIAAVGVALGSTVAGVEAIEAYRGDLAAWFLIAFGLIYAAWGLRRAYRHQPHVHWHAHQDGTVHAHEHTHERDHLHVHAAEASSRMAPWVLFTIFLFGPCEPLIPLVMYPAAKGDLWQAVPVVACFSLATLAAMLLIVLSFHRLAEGMQSLKLQRFGHALAGGVVFACGVAVKIGL
jgi:sulfite exporter TauE/SafE